jgi:hypothetical protein
MPYVLRKRLEEVCKYPIRLQFTLPNDEKICKYYRLDYGSPTYLRSSSILIVNKDLMVERVVNKSFEFLITSTGHYTGGNDNQCIYNRQVSLPQNFVTDYAIDSTMGLELTIEEVVYKYLDANCKVESTETERVFAEVNVDGSKDFEIKGVSGQVVSGSELLLNTLYEDRFFDALKFEINTAFRLGLYTATMVLIRKLFERQLIELLRQKYGMDNMGLFYSDGFLNLSELIRNLKTKLDDFKPYDFFKLEREKEAFVNFMFDIKEEGNASTHAFEPCLGYSEIMELKPLINKYSDLLVRMYRKVKEIPN